MHTNQQSASDQQYVGAASTYDSRNESLQIFDNELGQAVSARDLHAFLGSKQRFSDWMKNRIEKYGLVENQDYTSFNNFIKRGIGGTTTIEYALTIDAAKELAMVEGNEKGKQARQYFIECEKKLKRQSVVNTQTMTDAELISVALDRAAAILKQRSEELKKVTQVLEKQAPKVEYFEKVLDSESAHNITLIAKELGMTAAELNKRLHDEGVQFKSAGTWVLYAKYQNMGLTKTTTFAYTNSKGESSTRITTHWTEEGRMFIHRLVNKGLSQALMFIEKPGVFDIDLPFKSEAFKHAWQSYFTAREKGKRSFGWKTQRKALDILSEMTEQEAISELQKGLHDLGQTAPKNESEMDFKEGYRISDDGKITNLG